MSPAMAAEHGATALVAMVMLGMMAYGSAKHGFVTMFQLRLGRVVMLLSYVDFAGLALWH